MEQCCPPKTLIIVNFGHNFEPFMIDIRHETYLVRFTYVKIIHPT